MRRLYIFIIGIAALWGIGACNNGSAAEWSEMPEPIAMFVSKYFPRQGISKYTESGGHLIVDIANGAEICFNADRQWVLLDGRGETLPQMFLFDQMPPQLYAYLQQNDEEDEVYKAARNGDEYIVTLLDSTLDYSLATGSIRTAFQQ